MTEHSICSTYLVERDRHELERDVPANDAETEHDGQERNLAHVTVTLHSLRLHYPEGGARTGTGAATHHVPEGEEHWPSKAVAAEEVPIQAQQPARDKRGARFLHKCR